MQVFMKDLRIGDVLTPAMKTIESVEPTKDGGRVSLTMRDEDGRVTYGVYTCDSVVSVNRFTAAESEPTERKV